MNVSGAVDHVSNTNKIQHNHDNYSLKTIEAAQVYIIQVRIAHITLRMKKIYIQSPVFSLMSNTWARCLLSQQEHA